MSAARTQLPNHGSSPYIAKPPHPAACCLRYAALQAQSFPDLKNGARHVAIAYYIYCQQRQTMMQVRAGSARHPRRARTPDAAAAGASCRAERATYR
jgi:hypothetical protein